MNTLPPPAPAVKGGAAWIWQSMSPATAGAATAQPWVRLFHSGIHCPSPDFRRLYGPIHRFDHHTGRSSQPRSCSRGRTIIYLAQNLGTALAEVFGDETTATICPNYRVALLHVAADCRLQDLTGTGTIAIGALPSLCTGAVSRPRSQEWAQAIYRDEPAGKPIDGVYYHSAHDEGKTESTCRERPGRNEGSDGESE